MFIWTLFGTHDVPTQLWVSRDLDKQGNFKHVESFSFYLVDWATLGLPSLKSPVRSRKQNCSLEFLLHLELAGFTCYIYALVTFGSFPVFCLQIWMRAVSVTHSR